MRVLRIRGLLRWRQWLLGFLLIGAAGVLDLAMLRRSTMWPDELFSLAMATGHSVEHPAAAANGAEGDFIEAASPSDPSVFRRYVDHETPAASFSRVTRAVFLSDTNPPLYYLLLNLWTRKMGTTDGDLRSFSVLWTLASIPFLLALARRLGGPRAMVSTGLLFILSPNGVYYSTEGRMYSMLWFWVAANAYLTLRLREEKHPGGFDALWVLASAAGLLVHYFFIFPWSAMIVFLALRGDTRQRIRLAVNLSLTGLLILPWYRYLLESLDRWRVSGEWLNMRPDHFDWPMAAARLALQYVADVGYWLWWEHHVASFLLIGCYAFLVGLTIFRLKRRAFAGNRLLVLGWLAASFSGPLVFDFVRHTYALTTPRYVISGLPAVAILGGVALAGLPRVARTLVLLIILVCWSFNLVSIYQNGTRNDQPYWKIGQVLSAETTEGDLIIVHSVPTGVMAVARYTQTRAKMIDWVEQLGTRKTPDSVPPLIEGSRRIFLVLTHEAGAKAPIERWLREHADVTQDAHWGLSRMVEFRPKDRPAF